MAEVDKGIVSTVDGEHVRVLTPDGGITPPLKCSSSILASLNKGDFVVYIVFSDTTGMILCKIDE